MANWLKNNTGIILICLVALAFFVADGIHVIDYPPRSIHQWRQGDCVAYSINYYQQHLGFFQPAFNNLISDKGRSISEIPLLYYMAGKIYGIVGIHYWVLRGLTFCFYLLGLISLFQVVKFWIKEPLLQLLPVILFATTPYFYYYALNTLPNVPAIGVSLAGLYYMVLYQRSAAKKHIVAATLLFILSSLLKPTDGGVVWMAYLCVVVTNYVLKKQKDKTSTPIIISGIVIAVCMYGWYKYAVWYNAANANTLNLLGIYPIWDMTRNEINYTITGRIFGLWYSSYQFKYIFWLLVPLFVIYVARWRSLDPFLRMFTLFLLLGTVVYDILWFRAFSDLDYYQLINVIAPAFLTITVTEYFARNVYTRINGNPRYVVNAVLLTMILVSIFHNGNVQRDRYSNPDFVYLNPAINEVRPFLRKIGVAESDTVISVPDGTTNVSLVAFRNHGFTTEYAGRLFNVPGCRRLGAKYLIITDSNYIRDPYYSPYTNKLMGVYKGIYVYDIRQ